MESLGSCGDHGNSGSRTGSASAAVADSSRLVPEPSLRDLARLFLSLSGSRDQWGAVASSAISADAFPGAGLLPGSAAPGQVSAPSVCLSARVPAPAVGSPTGGPSAAGPSGLSERSRESSCSERRHGRSSSGERSHLSKKHRKARSPSPSRSSHVACSSASTLSASSGAGERGLVMPPPPASCSGAGGGLSGRDRLGFGCDRSIRPGPSGLGSGSRSSPVPGPSRLGSGGCASTSPSGAGDDDHSSTVNSLDTERDDSFRSVLRLIREFHNLEEPASVARTGARLLLLRFMVYSQSCPRLFTCLLPLCCGLSLRIQTRPCPSLFPSHP